MDWQRAGESYQSTPRNGFAPGVRIIKRVRQVTHQISLPRVSRKAAQIFWFYVAISPAEYGGVFLFKIFENIPCAPSKPVLCLSCRQTKQPRQESKMKISATMDLDRLAKIIGNEATEVEAGAVREALVELYDGEDTADVDGLEELFDDVIYYS